MAQELLTTFAENGGCYLKAQRSISRNAITVNDELLFDRKSAGALRYQEIKQIIRDKVAPEKSWTFRPTKQPTMTGLFYVRNTPVWQR
jgi:predicted Rdx family selenoprotein